MANVTTPPNPYPLRTCERCATIEDELTDEMESPETLTRRKEKILDRGDTPSVTIISSDLYETFEDTIEIALAAGWTFLPNQSMTVTTLLRGTAVINCYHILLLLDPEARRMAQIRDDNS